MRVSTANSYDNTIAHLARRQAELAAQQERVTTGMRVLKPSDDPVAATLAETAANRLSRTNADLRALEASRASLQQAESGLRESGDLIQQVRDLLITAGNATFTDAEREDVAKQLEGLREQLIAVANRKLLVHRAFREAPGPSPFALEEDESYLLTHGAAAARPEAGMALPA